MATFGPISDPTPNVLFDPARALGAAQGIQRNQLMMEHAKQDQSAQMQERDTNARIALARQFADAPDEALANEWGPAVQRMQQAGLGMGIDPTKPPPRDRLKQIAASDLTTFQKMKLEVEQAQAAAMGEYRQGMLGLAQQREARVASAPRGGGGKGDGIEFVPLGTPASAPAPSAGGGTTAGPAPAPAGPQMSEAAPEISPTAARLGGVDVAGPGAPPAPAPAGPPAGLRMMVRNGLPITTGLPTGQAWGQDASGARVVVDIPGVKKMGGDAPPQPIPGNSLDAGLMNILVGGNPASPEYAAAFARMGAEEVLPNGLTRRPDMSWARAPTFRPPAVLEPGSPGGPAQPPAGGRTFGTAEVKTPQGASPQAREAVRKVEQDVTRADEAISNFLKVHKEVGGGGLSAYLNNPSSPAAQRLLGAFESMKVTLRNESFLNTGVLQPAEAKMLDDTLLSPTTLRGAFASTEGLDARMDEIRKALKRGVSAARRSAGIDIQGPTSDSTAEPPAKPSGERPPLSSFGR